MAAMEIEFNPSQRSRMAAQPEPVTRRSNTPAPAAEAQPTAPAKDLQSQLKTGSVVRQDKVQEIQLQMLSQQYPPDAMVDRIASLLAVHFSN